MEGSMTTETTATTDPTALQSSIESLNAKMDSIIARQEMQAELIHEMQPIMTQVLAVASTQLESLEERGYFTFGREALSIADEVVSHYSADDVRQLGQNIVRILDTVRSLTQPDILEVTNEAAEALHRGNSEPMGILGMLKASRDNDVQRGMALILDVVRQIGRAERNRNRPRRLRRQSRIAQRLAPSSPQAKRQEQVRATPKANHQATTSAPVPALDFREDWTEDWAVSQAQALGYPVLSDEAWKLIRFARTEYERTGSSPNIRKLTKGAELSTKEVYSQFPKAPGRTVAFLAGIPKPAGCI